MPTISELSDVLDWAAVTALRAIDERDGAGLDALVDATGLDRERVANRCQQLSTLGLVTETEVDGGTVYEVTGSGHGAIGSGLYDEYDLVGEADLDELAAQVAELLERRDELQAQVEDLERDAVELRERAELQFGDRADVSEEFESLLADVKSLERALDEG
ncbi:hypothetical protein [Halorientalis halophila]|uniref:hypothetical protein n=1 Tax=Halorientalis halophila TaxID=3108499 RepID=UPI00300A1D2B